MKTGTILFVLMRRNIHSSRRSVQSRAIHNKLVAGRRRFEGACFALRRHIPQRRYSVQHTLVNDLFFAVQAYDLARFESCESVGNLGNVDDLRVDLPDLFR